MIPASLAHEIPLAFGLCSLTSQKRVDDPSREKKDTRGHQFLPRRLWAAYNISIAHGDAACQCLVHEKYHHDTGTVDQYTQAPKREKGCWQQFAKGKSVYCASIQLRLRAGHSNCNGKLGSVTVFPMLDSGHYSSSLSLTGRSHPALERDASNVGRMLYEAYQTCRHTFRRLTTFTRIPVNMTLVRCSYPAMNQVLSSLCLSD